MENGSTSTKRILRAKSIVVVLLGLLAAGCGSDVNITFNLINPCGDDVLADEGCRFIRLVVSSLNPRDPLHPDNLPGPLAKMCPIGEGKCSFGSSELLGAGRIMDAQCLVDETGSPVARATSQALLLQSGEGGNFNLLLGNIDGFVETTFLRGENAGTCSTLVQDGGRFGHTSTLLDDGRVLIVGGMRRIGTVAYILATAEIFDPRTGAHRQVAGFEGRPEALNLGRAFHTATKLRNGNVLITGGIGLVEGKWESLRSSEVFDSRLETFPEGQPWVAILGAARAHHTATMLNKTETGKVLVAGGGQYAGQDIVSYYDSAEIYDPATNTWMTTHNSMTHARAFHTATELTPTDQGKVLLVGGRDRTGTLNTVEIFDPDAGQFLPGVNITMAKNRAAHCAARLENGEVVVVGGTTGIDAEDRLDPTGVDAGVEIYSSLEGGEYGGFKNQALNLFAARMHPTCTFLEGIGDVLVAGGLTASGEATTVGEVLVVDDYIQPKKLTDLVDPGRYLHAASRLGNGWVYISGGLDIDMNADGAQVVTQPLLFVPETPYK